MDGRLLRDGKVEKRNSQQNTVTRSQNLRLTSTNCPNVLETFSGLEETQYEEY